MYNEPTDRVEGEKSDHAQFNSEVLDNIRYLHQGMPYVELTKTGWQSVTSAGLTFSAWTEVYDQEDMYTGSGADIVIPETGVYLSVANIYWAGGAGNGTLYEFNGVTYVGATQYGGRTVKLMKNTSVAHTEKVTLSGYYAWGDMNPFVVMAYFTAGDTLRLVVGHDSYNHHSGPASVTVQCPRWSVLKLQGPQT